MIKQRLFLVCLSLLAVFMFCACGDAAVIDSDVEGIQTFGETVDPSALPSTGQVIESTTSPAVSASTVSPSVSSSGEQIVDTNDHENENNDSTTSVSSGSADTSSASSSTSTNITSGSSSSSNYTPSTTQPNTGGMEDSVQNEEDGSSLPAISPPVAASEATIDEAQAYIGKSLSSLIADLGYPVRSDYDYVDEGNPDAGEIGTLYFYDYVVTTIRIDGDETITGVSAN